MYGAPTPHLTDQIVHALAPHLKVGVSEPEAAGTAKPGQPELAGRPVEVAHADVVNVYNGPVTNYFYNGSSGDGQPEEVIPS